MSSKKLKLLIFLIYDYQKEICLEILKTEKNENTEKKNNEKESKLFFEESVEFFVHFLPILILCK